MLDLTHSLRQFQQVSFFLHQNSLVPPLKQMTDHCVSPVESLRELAV